MDEIGEQIPSVAGGVGVLHVAAVGQDGVEGHFGVVFVADGVGIETLIDVATHEGGLVGEDGLDLTDLGGDAARACVHVGGDSLGVEVVGVAEEGGHGVAVGDVDVAARLVDVMDAVGALVQSLLHEGDGECGDGGGVLQGHGFGAVPTVGGVQASVASFGVRNEVVLKVANIGRREQEMLMAAGQFYGFGFVGSQGLLHHDHGGGLEVGVLRQGQTARAAAGVAVLVVDPEAQAETLALVGHEGEDGMLFGVLEVVTGADIADDTAEAAGLDVEEIVCDNGFFLVDGGIGGIGEVVDDLEREVGDVGGHGRTPFGRFKMQNRGTDFKFGFVGQGRCPCTPPETLLKKGFWTS